jgi:hypothetical protein
VNNRNSVLSVVAIVTAIAIVFSACRKINDATTVGGDLIPPVDNINTFDTLIDVTGYNDTFAFVNDSQYLARGEEYFLGLINNDPFFGKTDARLFLEFKPTAYGVYPFARKDSVKIDSIVLVLDYLETYGDTLTPQLINVYEIDNSSNFRFDSAYLIRKENVTYNTAFPLSKPGQFFIPKNLKDTSKAFRDTTTHQLRVKLDTNFARRLFNYDTSNAYKTDSIFRSKFRGFALRSEAGGNAIMGFDPGGASKLAIYYRYPKFNSGSAMDTTVNYFFFTTVSASANYIKRDYSGSPLESSVGNGTNPDPFLFIQNSPGSFAMLKIPGLSTISNRVVHRAELIVEQQYDISDSLFRVPGALYLDAYDPTITSGKKYRAIPYDVPFSFGQPSFSTPVFGLISQVIPDGSGNNVNIWKFNVTRYVQHILTKTQTNYDLRLYAPFTVSNKYGTPPLTTDPSTNFNINSAIARGRVRLIGNNGPGDTNPRRMRLRVIYSKL